MESLRTLEQLKSEFEKYLAYGEQVCNKGPIHFLDEIIQSILSYFENVTVLKWQRHWSALYSQWSTNLWYEIKCCKCKLV